MTILDDLFTRLLDEHGTRTAVGGPDGTLTYAELSGQAQVFADALRDRAPARLLLHGRNSPLYVAAYLGALRAGVVPFLLDPALGARETGVVVDSCGIDLVLCDQPPALSRVRAVREVAGWHLGSVRPAGERPALHPSTEVCRFTSGSTGVPNCIEFSGTAVHSAARSWGTATGMRADDRVLCFAGLFNGLGFNTSLLTVFRAGAALWLPTGLPSAGTVARYARAVRPTRLTAFPAVYESLTRRDRAIPELAGVRVALSSAAPLTTETRTRLLDRHDLAVCNYYGIAETGPLTFDDDPAPDRGLGTPVPGAELTTTGPEGDEILVRSASMGTRYLNAPGAFEAKIDADGWYRTGDRGRITGGRLFLHGRGGKGINIGGRKVDETEVRTTLLDVPGVEAAVVFGVEKTNGDPMLVAVVSGPTAAGPGDLRAHCLGRLAAYKVPERFVILPEMPATSLGKPRMSELRELVRSRREENP